MRVYRWLLRLSPAALRREYGAAMEETFARRMADARAAGGWRPVQLWMREAFGAIAFAISEHSSAASQRRRQRQQQRLQRHHRRQQQRLQWQQQQQQRRQLDLDTRKAPPMHGIHAMRRELQYAARRLTRNLSFTLPAVLTLALAIGANASIFAIVQHVVLNPLPYPDSDRIVLLDHGALGLNFARGIGMSEGMYYEYLDHARTLEQLALYSTSEETLTRQGEPERVRVSAVTPSLGSVLRVSPALGRWFTEAEGEPGAARLAVISHGLWLRRYGGDASLLGQAIMLDGVPTQVIGVMPPGFAFPSATIDAWTAAPLKRASGFGIFSYNGVARLRPGVTLAAARTDLNAAIAAIPQAYPEYPKTIGYHLDLVAVPITLKDAIVGPVARGLWILLASVGFVLLIACANVANLCLVRAEAQQRDIAIRRALGAGGTGVARYFLAESLLLAAAGGTIGFGLAWGAVRLLVTTAPSSLPRIADVRIDAIVAAFTLALVVGVAIAFAALPLLRPAPLVSALQSGSRSQTASRSRHRLRRVLMGAQVALALVLLVFSGLMIRSFEKLRAIDPGFDPRSTLTFSVGLPARDYPDRRANVAAHQAMLDRLAALPGVTAVSAGSCQPLDENSGDGGCFGNTLFVEGRPMPEGSLPPGIQLRAVAGNYFQAMGIRVLRGRGIERHDVDHDDEPVVVINQSAVHAYFPHEDPIGHRIASSKPPSMRVEFLTIVGIVADTPSGSLVEPRTVPAMYMPMSAARGPEMPITSLVGPSISVMTYVLRTTTPPQTLVAAARRVVHEVDPNLPIVQVRTLQEIVDHASAYMAFTMVLLAIAASVALLLGAIGIYGVTSYIVSQRRAEIGLRLALGAEPRSVVRMIVRQGGMVTFVGVIVGVATALATSRLLGSLLYQVSDRDPGVFISTTVTLLAIALLACWLPARRAARLNPLDTLRAD